MAEATETAHGSAGVGTDPSAVLRPTRPHDSMSFEELAAAYNFERTSMHRTMFARLIVRECQRRGGPVGGSGPLRVLDVGCGRGIGREVALHHAIRPHVGDYWGIEPDEEVTPEAGLFDHFQHALMETATLRKRRSTWCTRTW